MLSSLKGIFSKTVLTGIVSLFSDFKISTEIVPFLIASKDISLPFANKRGLKLTLSIFPGIKDSFIKLKYPFNSMFSLLLFISVISAYESCTIIHLVLAPTNALYGKIIYPSFCSQVNLLPLYHK